MVTVDFSDIARTDITGLAFGDTVLDSSALTTGLGGLGFVTPINTGLMTDKSVDVKIQTTNGVIDCPKAFTITSAQPKFQSFSPSSATTGLSVPMTITVSNFPLPASSSCASQSDCQDIGISFEWGTKLDNVKEAVVIGTGSLQKVSVAAGTATFVVNTPESESAGAVSVVMDLGTHAGLGAFSTSRVNYGRHYLCMATTVAPCDGNENSFFSFIDAKVARITRLKPTSGLYIGGDQLAVTVSNLPRLAASTNASTVMQMISFGVAGTLTQPSAGRLKMSDAETTIFEIVTPPASEFGLSESGGPATLQITVAGVSVKYAFDYESKKTEMHMSTFPRVGSTVANQTKYEVKVANFLVCLDNPQIPQCASTGSIQVKITNANGDSRNGTVLSASTMPPVASVSFVVPDLSDWCDDTSEYCTFVTELSAQTSFSTPKVSFNLTMQEPVPEVIDVYPRSGHHGDAINITVVNFKAGDASTYAVVWRVPGVADYNVPVSGMDCTYDTDWKANRCTLVTVAPTDVNVITALGLNLAVMQNIDSGNHSASMTSAMQLKKPVIPVFVGRGVSERSAYSNKVLTVSAVVKDFPGTMDGSEFSVLLTRGDTVTIPLTISKFLVVGKQQKLQYEVPSLSEGLYTVTVGFQNYARTLSYVHEVVSPLLPELKGLSPGYGWTTENTMLTVRISNCECNNLPSIAFDGVNAINITTLSCGGDIAAFQFMSPMRARANASEAQVTISVLNVATTVGIVGKFSYVTPPTPKILWVQPTTVAMTGGAKITIQVENLPKVGTDMQVKFGSTSGKVQKVDTAAGSKNSMHTVVVALPSGLGVGNQPVTLFWSGKPAEQASDNSKLVLYNPFQPRVDDFFPAKGFTMGDTAVTIKMTNLFNSQVGEMPDISDIAVCFGSCETLQVSPDSIKVLSDECKTMQLLVVTPASATVKTCRVTVKLKNVPTTNAAFDFDYLALPTGLPEVSASGTESFGKVSDQLKLTLTSFLEIGDASKVTITTAGANLLWEVVSIYSTTETTVIEVKTPLVRAFALLNKPLRITVAPTKDPTKSASFFYQFNDYLPDISMMSPESGLVSGGNTVRFKVSHLEGVSSASAVASYVTILFGSIVSPIITEESKAPKILSNTEIEFYVLAPTNMTAGDTPIYIRVNGIGSVKSSASYKWEPLPDGTAPVDSMSPQWVYTTPALSPTSLVTVKMSNFRMVASKNDLVVYVGGNLIAGENITSAQIYPFFTTVTFVPPEMPAGDVEVLISPAGVDSNLANATLTYKALPVSLAMVSPEYLKQGGFAEVLVVNLPSQATLFANGQSLTPTETTCCEASSAGVLSTLFFDDLPEIASDSRTISLELRDSAGSVLAAKNMSYVSAAAPFLQAVMPPLASVCGDSMRAMVNKADWTPSSTPDSLSGVSASVTDQGGTVQACTVTAMSITGDIITVSFITPGISDAGDLAGTLTIDDKSFDMKLGFKLPPPPTVSVIEKTKAPSTGGEFFMELSGFPSGASATKEDVVLRFTTLGEDGVEVSPIDMLESEDEDLVAFIAPFPPLTPGSATLEIFHASCPSAKTSTMRIEVEDYSKPRITNLMDTPYGSTSGGDTFVLELTNFPEVKNPQQVGISFGDVGETSASSIIQSKGIAFPTKIEVVVPRFGGMTGSWQEVECSIYPTLDKTHAASFIFKYEKADAPIVDGSASPSTVYLFGGQFVQVKVKNLPLVADASAVTALFGNTQAASVYVISSDAASTSLRLEAPPAAITGETVVTITANGDFTDSGTVTTPIFYAANPLPTIQKVDSTDPHWEGAQGPMEGGNTLKLFVTNLFGVSTKGQVQVKFDSAVGVIKGVKQGIDSTLVVVQVPASTSAGAVTMSVFAKSSGSSGAGTMPFTYVDTDFPTLVKIAPDQFIMGQNKVANLVFTNYKQQHDASGYAVQFDGIDATVMKVKFSGARTILKLAVPTALSTAGVRIGTMVPNGVVSKTMQFGFTAVANTAPVVTHFFPSNGPTIGGTTVTLTVENLADVTAAAHVAVTFGGVAGTVSSVTATTVSDRTVVALEVVTPQVSAGTTQIIQVVPTGVDATDDQKTATVKKSKGFKFFMLCDFQKYCATVDGGLVPNPEALLTNPPQDSKCKKKYCMGCPTHSAFIGVAPSESPNSVDTAVTVALLDFPEVSCATDGEIGSFGSPCAAANIRATIGSVPLSNIQLTSTKSGGFQFAQATIDADNTAVGSSVVEVSALEPVCNKMIKSNTKFSRFWGPDGSMSVARVSPSSGMVAGGDQVTLKLENQLETYDAYTVTCGDQTAEVLDTTSVISDKATKQLPFTLVMIVMPPGIAGAAECTVRSGARLYHCS